MDNTDYAAWQLITLHCSHDPSLLVIGIAAVWTWGIRHIAVDSVNSMTTGNMSTGCYVIVRHQKRLMTSPMAMILFGLRARGFYTAVYSKRSATLWKIDKILIVS